ncbi:TonB family protein [uncultured Rhodoblastus sp.]|uniref:TonB family protein n=1 Tax=uncultured Rhodoblastus sp. TaxID=543037 RepID=UPI0025E60A89|nr:TonB family protein [uncultured Rhodoblastus sp.]
MVLAALPEERPNEGPRSSIRVDRRRFAFLIALCFLLHTIPLVLLAYLGGPADLAPDEQAIPVEMIAEPPPPKQPDQPPPKSEQEAKKIPFDETPATDAPRAANEEKVKKDATDDASHAPKPTPDSESTAKKPISEPAQSAEKPVEAKAAEASAPKLKEDRPDAEPVNAAEIKRPETPDQTKAQQAAPQPEKREAPAPPPMPTIAALPDYSFAPASQNSPIAGGKAASTYLTIVYGMLASHMHMPPIPAGRKHSRGEISFDVDFAGALIRARVTKSTGVPELDAAAVAAIRAAAPFPLPPTGNGISLRLNFSGD